MLGRNRVVPRETWPENAPSIFAIRRSLALHDGKEPPGRDDPIDDDEYAVLLAAAKSGVSRKVG